MVKRSWRRVHGVGEEEDSDALDDKALVFGDSRDVKVDHRWDRHRQVRIADDEDDEEYLRRGFI